jgi:hypothetical protein
MSNNNILSYLIDYNGINFSKLSSSVNYLKKINQNNKIYIIDMTNFLFHKKDSNILKKKINGTIYFKPKNLFEVFKFFKKKKVFVVGPVFGELNSIFIHILLKILGVKIILINFWGFYLNVGMTKKNLFKNSFRSKIKYFINIKLYYFFYRFFSTVGVLPKIFYYFESSSKRINNLKNSFGYKFSKRFNSQLFKYFLNVYRINSIFYDRLYKKKIKINGSKNKHIVLVDSGYVDHPDYNLRNYIDPNKKKILRFKHYSRLFNILHKIGKKTKKKIVFCLHPRVYYNHGLLKNKKNDILYVKNQTEKYISKAYIVIFTGGSSLINMAILNKKKILILLDKDNTYSRTLISSLTIQIKLKIILLKDNLIMNFNKLNFDLNKKLKNYDNFINQNLIYKKNTSSYYQIKNYLDF